MLTFAGNGTGAKFVKLRAKEGCCGDFRYCLNRCGRIMQGQKYLRPDGVNFTKFTVSKESKNSGGREILLDFA
jgi:hypothetical protein